MKSPRPLLLLAALAWLAGFAAQVGTSAAAPPLADPARMVATVRHFATFEDGTPRSRYCYRTEMDVLEEDLRLRLEEALAPRGGAAELWSFAARRVPGKWDTTGVIPYRTTFHNVMGTLPGTDPAGGTLFITSHFDAVGAHSLGWKAWQDPAPGADDNMSGTAAVLELARLMAGDALYPFTIRFVCFDAEEMGLWGSDTLVKVEKAAGTDILGAINMDMIAYNPRRDSLVVMTNRGSSFLADYLVETERLDPQPEFEIVRSLNNIYFSDHAPFWDQGYPAVLLIESLSVVAHNPDYHRITDLSADISRDGRMMAKGANVILKTIRRLAAGAAGPVRYRLSEADLLVSVNRIFENKIAVPGDTIQVTAGLFNVGGRAIPDEPPLLAIHRIVDGVRREPPLLETVLDQAVATGRHVTVPLRLPLVTAGDVGAITVEAELRQGNAVQTVRRAIPVRSQTSRLVTHYMAPNPVRDVRRTALAYELSREATVRITLFDFHGQEIGKQLYEDSGIPTQPGPNAATGLNRVPLPDLLNGVDPAPGVYLYRIEVFPEGAAEGISVVGKFAIVR